MPLLELQTQLLIAEDLQYLSGERMQELGSQADRIGRGLNGLINSLCEKTA